MMNIDNIRELFVEKYKNKDFVILKNGTKTIEIDNAHFEVNKDYIFKMPDYNYINKEIKWYETCECNINAMDEPIPKIWKNVCGKNGEINSNYGWCVYSKHNYYQFENCLKELIRDPSSRRACMIYNRPSMHIDQNINGAQDFMCTYAVQCLIRNNVLIYTVLMRSNDAIFGFRSDYGWHKYIAEKLFDALNNVGKHIKGYKIIWNAVSLHIYESGFKYIDEYIKNDYRIKVKETLSCFNNLCYDGNKFYNDPSTNNSQIFFSDF